MPTSTTIKVRYANGNVETFTGCTISGYPDDTTDYLIFEGTLTGDGEEYTHKIRIAPGMRYSVRTA